jgi:hypothetical protein
MRDELQLPLLKRAQHQIEERKPQSRLAKLLVPVLPPLPKLSQRPLDEPDGRQSARYGVKVLFLYQRNR